MDEKPQKVSNFYMASPFPGTFWALSFNSHLWSSNSHPDPISFLLRFDCF